MDTSPNLTLPYLLPNQAQKHVTVNEALRALDALTQIGIVSRSLATPPGAPVGGERYLIASGATGDWLGEEGNLAAWQDGAWAFHTPRPGWVAWVEAEQTLITFDGTNWITASDGSVNPTPLVGINATADTTNRLSLASAASLFNHDGTDHRLKINKSTATDTASLILQSGFSGRAEIGLVGDDELRVKVSDDGSSWKTALTIDPATGIQETPAMRSGKILINADSIATITPPSAGGFVFIMIVSNTYPRTEYAGIFAYDTGLSPNLTSLALGASISNQGTATLSGTTGPDSSLNIAVAQDQLTIESRYSSNKWVSYTFIG